MIEKTWTNEVYREDQNENKTVLSWKVESDVLGTLGSHVTLTGKLNTYTVDMYIVEKTVDLLAAQMKRLILRAMKENDIITTNDRPTNDPQ